MNIIESRCHVTVEPLDYARQLKKMLSMDSMTIPELAKRIGKSEDFIKQYLSLLDQI